MMMIDKMAVNGQWAQNINGNRQHSRKPVIIITMLPYNILVDFASMVLLISYRTVDDDLSLTVTTHSERLVEEIYILSKF